MHKKTGFTLIEVMLVVALMFAIGTFVSPIGISFYRSQLTNETADGLLSVLRQAQNYSMSGKGDSAHGVSLQSNAYVLFAGDTYATRMTSEDVVFSVPSSVAITGPSEVVFTEFSGAPSATGTFSITMGSRQKQVEILTSGTITR